MPTSIPIGTFASRATIRSRATFSRRAISPQAPSPIRCSVFFPGSIPIVTITALGLRDMGGVPSVIAPPACFSVEAGARPVPPILGSRGSAEQGLHQALDGQRLLHARHFGIGRLDRSWVVA